MYDDYEARELAERRAARDRAAARHAGNLAAVDALLVLVLEDAAAGWTPPGPIFDQAAARSALLVAFWPNLTAQLEARRRVLERHQPDVGITGDCWPIDCSRCFDAQENALSFPCEDYEDAAAGLVMPHRVRVTLDEATRTADVACCCRWSRPFHYRRATGGPVAERLARLWGDRHLAGEPDAQLDAGPGTVVAL